MSLCICVLGYLNVLNISFDEYFKYINGYYVPKKLQKYIYIHYLSKCSVV